MKIGCRKIYDSITDKSVGDFITSSRRLSHNKCLLSPRGEEDILALLLARCCFGGEEEIYWSEKQVDGNRFHSIACASPLPHTLKRAKMNNFLSPLLLRSLWRSRRQKSVLTLG